MSARKITNPTAGVGGKLVRGVLWSGLNTFLLRIGQFVISIVLARLISPSQFGVFVVASTIYLIIINISEVGVSTALVREVDNSDLIAPTITTIAIANSAVLALGMYLAAPYLSAALGASAATNAVRVLAIPLFLAGPTAVPAALMVRDFQQGRKFVSDFTNFLVSNGTLLVMAIHGNGAMALAWSRTAGQIASAILLYVLVSKRYWPGFNPREAKRLLRFGLPLAGANLIGFSLSNVDFMAVGKLSGSMQLGYYDMAYSVSSWPISIFSSILSSVTLPVLARVRGGIKEIERHLAAALSALCSLAFPVSAACMVLAHPMVLVVYGAKWSPTAPMLVVLSVFAGARVIIALFSDLLVALGKTRALFNLQLLWLCALVPAMVLLVHLHKGVGASEAHVVVVLLVVLPAYLLALLKSAQVSLRPLIGPVVRPLIASAIAAGVVAFSLRYVSSPAPQMILGCALFLAVYVILLGRWLLRLKNELGELYREDSKKRRRRHIGRHRRTYDPEPAWSYVGTENQ